MPDERPRSSWRRRLTVAEMDELELETWARRLGFDEFDDLVRLEAVIFRDLLAPRGEGEPVRVRQVDPNRRRR